MGFFFVSFGCTCCRNCFWFLGLFFCSFLFVFVCIVRVWWDWKSELSLLLWLSEKWYCGTFSVWLLFSELPCFICLHQNCFWVLFCLQELFKLSVVLVGSKLDQFDSYFLCFLLLLFLFVWIRVWWKYHSSFEKWYSTIILTVGFCSVLGKNINLFLVALFTSLHKLVHYQFGNTWKPMNFCKNNWTFMLGYRCKNKWTFNIFHFLERISTHWKVSH